MIKENLMKIKDILKVKETENTKKKIENLVVFIVILIVTIIIINAIWKNDKSLEKEEKEDNTKILSQVDSNKSYEESSNDLESKLENILGNIKGVGKVKVLLTYSQSSQNVAMYNEDSTKSDTEETDTQGGNRKISEYSSKKEIIYQEIDGEKIPVMQSVIEPKIEGAIVTAVGAQDSNIKTNIIQAIEAATGLATHKIQVFEMIN